MADTTNSSKKAANPKADTASGKSSDSGSGGSGATDSGATASGTGNTDAGKSGASDTADGATTPAKSNGGGGAARETSYFSSVSTNQYRSGWDTVFGGAGARKARPSRRAREPVEIRLDWADLSDAERAVLSDAFRRKARAMRRNYERLAGGRTMTWDLVCRFDD